MTGHTHTRGDPGSTPIPSRLNLLVMTASLIASGALLWTASHASHWGVVVAAAVGFSLVNNTNFSLLHEAVHGMLHERRWVNESAGRLLAGMFPTSFSIQRASHFGHHRRNRTDLEMYDYYLPHQSRWLKTYWIYCLLTGFYWAIIPVACVVYLLNPWAFGSRWFVNGPARWWGFESFVEDINRQPRARVWLELVGTALVQLTLWLTLDLTLVGWLACYWAFGLNWSSLQYVDHAWSERDVREGAWNLKVSPLGRLFFLNYHFHLVHHRAPNIPWLYLPRFVRPEDPNPSFWKIYFSLWGGARPAPPGPGPEPLTGGFGRRDGASR
ncbi:MAG TPA: fatty acid desaturase [Longimicrobiales bacterium]|nr:fatty acid desaturase [Longimicrobiales bacterium]